MTLAEQEDYLRLMAKRDLLMLEEGHDIEMCGMCYHAFLWSEVAREMVEKGDFEDGISISLVRRNQTSLGRNQILQVMAGRNCCWA